MNKGKHFFFLIVYTCIVGNWTFIEIVLIKIYYRDKKKKLTNKNYI